jgi:O-antigen ligase
MGLAAGLIVFGLLVNKKIRWIIILCIIICSLGIGLYAPLRTKAIDAFTLMDLSGQIRKAQWKETWMMLSDGRLITGSGLANYQATIKPYHAEGIFVVDPHDPDWHRKTVFNKEFRDSVWQPVEIYMYPHNIYLNFWSELGIFGMLLFCWIFVKFIYLGFRNLKLIGNCLPSEALAKVGKLEIRNRDKASLKYLNTGLICSMVVILIHGLVDVPYFKNDLSVIFWVLIAVMGMVNLELRFKN